MREIYLAADPVNAEIVKDYLMGYGIDAVVRGAHLWSGQGELPANSYPAVWILNECDETRARELVSRLEKDRSENVAWKCPDCNEHLPGQFTACWKCGCEQPGENQ